MIKIDDKHNCCGCEACVQTCPKQCISICRDAEGFLYPKADDDVCVNCGLCEKVCPVVNQFEKRNPQKTYAAINPDDGVRNKSSSGGLFTLLAEDTISKGGVVFGARFDETWQVVIDYATTAVDLKPFQGSKYLQARIDGSYIQCKKFLEEGREVMFSGTPCQIAGLHHYLRKHYDNLLSVEVICHGAPSPKVWSRYISEVIKIGMGNEGFALQEGNKIMLYYPHHNNAFMRAYLSDLISRPSCETCPAKEGRSHADITLADFWGIERVEPSMFDDKGTSMVLVHTDKGRDAIPFKRLQYKECDPNALQYNSSYIKSSVANPRRTIFFEALENTNNLHMLIGASLRPSFMQRIESIKNPMGLVKNMLNKIIRPVPTRGGGYLSKKEYCSLLSLSKNPHISGISFRDKRAGWKSYSLSIEINLDG